MRVLITGGDGFIGSHLADKLVENGHKVSLFDLKFGRNTQHLDCEKIVGDIRDYEAVKKCINDKDAVFHFAAVSRVVWGQEDPIKCVETNTLGTLKILEAIRKTGNNAILFFGSSREVYGEPNFIPVTEDHPKTPISVYGVAKLAAENLSRSFFRSFGTKSVIFRFSNVYGTERDQLDRVTPKFMLRAMKNEPLTLYGGDQILDFTFIDDTVDGITKALKKTTENEFIGENFHFVTGRGTSIKELAKIITKICGSDSKISVQPEKRFDVKKFVGSTKKTNKFLGYKPKVSLEEGLKNLKGKLMETLSME